MGLLRGVELCPLPGDNVSLRGGADVTGAPDWVLDEIAEYQKDDMTDAILQQSAVVCVHFVIDGVVVFEELETRAVGRGSERRRFPVERISLDLWPFLVVGHVRNGEMLFEVTGNHEHPVNFIAIQHANAYMLASADYS